MLSTTTDREPLGEWVAFSDRFPTRFPCLCMRRRRSGGFEGFIVEKQGRRFLSPRWHYWISFEWADMAELENRYRDDLNESGLTREQMIEQAVRNKKQLE